MTDQAYEKGKRKVNVNTTVNNEGVLTRAKKRLVKVVLNKAKVRAQMASHIGSRLLLEKEGAKV